MILVIPKTHITYFPPYITNMSNRDKKWIDRFWKIFGDDYIVDPVSGGQAYAIMYDRIPWILRKLFFKCEVRETIYKSI